MVGSKGQHGQSIPDRLVYAPCTHFVYTYMDIDVYSPLIVNPV